MVIDPSVVTESWARARRLRGAVRRARLPGLLAALVSACHPGVTAPAPPPSADRPEACAAALAEQARASLESGRLERARAQLEQLTERCPDDRGARHELLATLAALGRRAEAGVVAGQIEADPSAPVDERAHARQLADSIEGPSDAQALAWVTEGLAARRRGDTAAGQWLLDRALVALERGERVSLDLANGPRGLLPWQGATQSPLSRRRTVAPVASADGQRLAVAAGPEVRVLDVRTRRELHAMRLPATATSLAMAADGSRLAAAASDRSVTVWNLTTGRGKRLEPGVAPVTLALAGDRVVVSDDESTERVDLATGKGEVLRGALRGVDARGEVLLEQGKRLAVTGGSGWSAPAGAGAMLSPAGAWVAVARAGSAGGVDVWPLPGGAPRVLVARAAGPWRLVAASAGRLLAAAADGTALLADTTSGQVEAREGWRPVGLLGDEALLESDHRWALARVGVPLRELPERPGAVLREVFLAPPLLLSRAGVDGALSPWDTPTLQPLAPFDAPHAEALRSPALRSDLAALAGVDPDGTPRLLWLDRDTQASLPAGGDATRAVAFVGPRLASFADGRLRQFGADDGQPQGVAERPTVGRLHGAFGGSLLATLAPHGWLQLFDLPGGQGLKTLEGSRLERTVAVGLSSDARWAVASERGGELRLWSIPDGGRPVRSLPGHSATVKGLAFASPDRLCSGDEAGVVLCRDLPDGEPTALVPASTLGEVTALVGLEDHTLLVVAQTLLGVRARVFDPNDGRQLRSIGELLPIDGDGIAASGGVLLAPSSITGATLLWRLRDGAPIGALRVLHDGRGAYFVDPTGHVDLLGTSLDGVGVCRVGPRSFPSELCLERFESPGLLHRALVAATSATASTERRARAEPGR